jgi:hypothetical protein
MIDMSLCDSSPFDPASFLDQPKITSYYVPTYALQESPRAHKSFLSPK